MQILMISFEFPPEPGGIGTYSYEMARHLQLLGHDVTMIAYSHEMESELIESFDRQQPYKTLRYRPTKNKLLTIFHRIKYALTVFRQGNFNLLFIPHPRAGLIGLFIKKMTGIPYVMTGHGSEFLVKGRILKKMIYQIYQEADHIITNSRYTTALMKQMNISNPDFSAIPLGADPLLYNRDRYERIELQKKYNCSGRKIILTVGKLSERKGHRRVIEAIEKLRHEIPEVLYIVAGRGVEYENLQQIIKNKGLEDNVRLAGFVSSENLPEYYALCDVFILNSTIAGDGDVEGFGIVLIEAGLMGKPVIGTSGSGMEDAIEHNKSGLLIPMDNPGATTTALRHLLMNPEVASQMGEYGYSRAIGGYTWPVVVQKTADVLEMMWDKKKQSN